MTMMIILFSPLRFFRSHLSGAALWRFGLARVVLSPPRFILDFFFPSMVRGWRCREWTEDRPSGGQRKFK